MSKISHPVMTVTETSRTVRRTIDHSPNFGGEGADDSPAGRIPPGGFLTG